MKSVEEIYDGLSDETRKKALACKTPEELHALAQSEGVELTDEMLESVSGAWTVCGIDCTGIVCELNYS